MNEVVRLYHATEEALRFAIGALTLESGVSAPLIQIAYSDWPLWKLSTVRDALAGGVTLQSTDMRTGCRIHIASRERMSISIRDDPHTSVLSAPAWDAQLEDVASSVWRRFEADRQGFGAFVLVLQSAGNQFVSAFARNGSAIRIDPIGSRMLVSPVSP